MAKFKVGDKVIGNYKADLKYSCTVKGWKGLVTEVKQDGRFETEDFGFLDEECFDLLEEGKNNADTSASKNNMNLVQKFAMLLKGEPMKSFFKAGITNADYTFTTEGKEIFMQWLLTKNGDAFKTEVVDLLLANEDKK